ncbi:MAG: hypothetical protein RSB38_05275, partial [Oscillospiraceae bacterium]
DKTIGDFNRVNAAKNIQMLSGVTMSENLPVTLYQIIACAMGLLLGMIFAITIEITRKIKREK